MRVRTTGDRRGLNRRAAPASPRTWSGEEEEQRSSGGEGGRGGGVVVVVEEKERVASLDNGRERYDR